MKVLAVIALVVLIGGIGVYVLRSQATEEPIAQASEGCTNCDSQNAQATMASHEGHAGMEGHSHMTNGDPKGKVNDKGQASGPTMEAVYSGRNLYTCPMHKQVVTDNSEGKCPLCGMNLTKMDEEAVNKLRTSDPKGCVMDPIVRKGSDEHENCDICNMKLIPIPKPTMGDES